MCKCNYGYVFTAAHALLIRKLMAIVIQIKLPLGTHALLHYINVLIPTVYGVLNDNSVI